MLKSAVVFSRGTRLSLHDLSGFNTVLPFSLSPTNNSSSLLSIEISQKGCQFCLFALCQCYIQRHKNEFFWMASGKLYDQLWAEINTRETNVASNVFDMLQYPVIISDIYREIVNIASSTSTSWDALMNSSSISKMNDRGDYLGACL